MKYDHSHKGYLSSCNLSIIDLTRRNGMRFYTHIPHEKDFQTKKINWNKDYLAPTIFEKEHVQQYFQNETTLSYFYLYIKTMNIFWKSFSRDSFISEYLTDTFNVQHFPEN